MKLPIQVAPVQRGNSTARYATNSGIKPSENLCSCSGGLSGCGVGWSHCPDGYEARCETYTNNTWGIPVPNCGCRCCRIGTNDCTQLFP